MKVKPILKNVKENTFLEDYLKCCGVKDTQEFIKPTGKYLENPFDYENMNRISDIIISGLEKKAKFGILQDPDSDGVMSASLIYKYLKKIDNECNIKVFFHKGKFHGLGENGLIQEIIDSKVDFMIIPDASSGECDLHKELLSNGILTMICDHHPTDMRSKFAYVSNNQISDKIFNKAGSGTLVTYKLTQAIDKKLNLRYSKDLIDMVWFSLVGDIMSMNTMENACFRYWAKKNIKNKMLLAFIKVLVKDKELNNTVISWDIQPKISAIIRCENQELKEKLFFALAEEKQEDINYVIENYSKAYNQQKNTVNEYYEENVNKVDNDFGIIFQNIGDFYSFYTGLVASKYVNKFNKPVILYKENNGEYSCSVRSPFPVKNDLKESGLFTFVEGHDSSFGCGFTNENFEKVKQFCKNYYSDYIYPVCAELEVNTIPKSLFFLGDKFMDLWGKDVNYPMFYIPNIKINSDDIKVIGKNKTTVSFQIGDVNFIKFFCTNEFKENLFIGQGKDLNIEIIGELHINEFRGYQNKQVVIKEIEINY